MRMPLGVALKNIFLKQKNISKKMLPLPPEIRKVKSIKN